MGLKNAYIGLYWQYVALRGHISHQSLGKGSFKGNYRVFFKGIWVIQGSLRVVRAYGRGAKATRVHWPILLR